MNLSRKLTNKYSKAQVRLKIERHSILNGIKQSQKKALTCVDGAKQQK